MKLTYTMKYRPDQLPGDLCVYLRPDRGPILDVFVSVNNHDSKTYLLLLANNVVRNGSAFGCDEVISYDDRT